MTSKEKTKFRTTKEWKEFRISMLEKTEKSCEMCGTRYSGKRTRMLQVHHHNPDQYTNLNPEYFSVLCSSCHKDTVERFVKKLCGKGSREIPNLGGWLNLLWPHLTFKAKDSLRNNKIVIEDVTGWEYKGKFFRLAELKYDIYLITFPNSKYYVGKSYDAETRFMNHCDNSENPKFDTFVYRAIRKYGVESLKMEVIESVKSKKEANDREKYWISKLGTTDPTKGYNMTLGGDGGDTFSCLPEDQKERRREFNRKQLSELRELGLVNSPEHRKRCSERMKSNNPAKLPEVRKKISENHADVSGENHPNYGNSLSEEVREKIRKSKIGKKASEETKKKLREKSKGGNNPNAKRIRCIELDLSFDTMKDAHKYLKEKGLSDKNKALSLHLKGNEPLAFGYTWEILEKDKEQ